MSIAVLRIILENANGFLVHVLWLHAVGPVETCAHEGKDLSLTTWRNMGIYREAISVYSAHMCSFLNLLVTEFFLKFPQCKAHPSRCTFGNAQYALNGGHSRSCRNCSGI
jgi:hypothetical protein